MKKLTLAAAALCVALGGTVARAQDAGALLDLLVKKRLISDQEAEEVRSELVKESASTAAGKWKLSAPITEVELYGDVRLRYEYRGGRLPSNNQGDFGQDHLNDWYERHRERYRLRVGLRGTLADDWFFGLRLETSNSPRSTNVTFGADSPGPFSKGDDGIFVGQAYFGYTGFPDFKFTGGRMPQPLITTSMLWDDDINPEGLAEQWKHTFTFDLGGGGGEAVQSYSKEGYSKEGKTVVAKAAEPFKLKLDVFANFAQYVYDDENPENPIGPNPVVGSGNGSQTGQKIPTTDAFMMAWQVGARLTFPSSIYVQLAPTLYNYTGNGDTFNIHYLLPPVRVQHGDPVAIKPALTACWYLIYQRKSAGNSGTCQCASSVSSLTISRVTIAHRAAGDFDHTGQHYAWMLGGAIGQLKAKNDWEIRAWYQYADQFALDPNLVDSDIFDSRVNEKGVAVKAGYMVADAISLNLTWAYAWRINGSLGTGGSGDIPINPLDQYQIFQADMSVKF